MGAQAEEEGRSSTSPRAGRDASVDGATLRSPDGEIAESASSDAPKSTSAEDSAAELSSQSESRQSISNAQVWTRSLLSLPSGAFPVWSLLVRLTASAVSRRVPCQRAAGQLGIARAGV